MIKIRSNEKIETLVSLLQSYKIIYLSFMELASLRSEIAREIGNYAARQFFYVIVGLSPYLARNFLFFFQFQEIVVRKFICE